MSRLIAGVAEPGQLAGNQTVEAGFLGLVDDTHFPRTKDWTGIVGLLPPGRALTLWVEAHAAATALASGQLIPDVVE